MTSFPLTSKRGHALNIKTSQCGPYGRTVLLTWAWSCPVGVWKYSALNLAIHFDIAFVVETWLVGWFRSPKSKEEETGLVSEAIPKATQ